MRFNSLLCGRPHWGAYLKKEKMEISLKQVISENELKNLWKMQICAFSDLLSKYKDFETNPGAESLERVIEKYQQPWTKYYFIINGDTIVGGVRVIDKKNESRKRISPIWIMKEFRGNGYAQKAIIELEKLYGSTNWCLDTILQEKGNIHLYEKLGYHQTGKTEKINNLMDIVFLEKN